MDTLYLMYEGNLVGSFESDENYRLDFKYTKLWLTKENSFPVSISMPMGNSIYRYPVPNIFLENLLPEEKIRKLIERKSRFAKDSPYQFLKEFGYDLAGAFTLSTSSTIKETKTSEVVISFSYIDKAIDEGLNLYQSIVYDHGAKFSLAGAQDKFCAIYRKGKLFLSRGNRPSTHIAKINFDFKNSQTVYNEFFCMTLAKKIGLNTPDVCITGDKHPILLVERYDRITYGKEIKRIHQEDFCQAQSISSQEKYEDRGGPTIYNNFELIKKNCSVPIVYLDSFLNWLAFNLIIGNNDTHSKNLSLLYDGKSPKLAPFYDLLSTEVYGHRFSKSFAFNIGGTFQHDKLRKIHIEQFEDKMGLNQGTFLKNFSKIAKKIEEHSEGTLRELKAIAPKSTIGGRVIKIIDHRLKHFRLHGGLDI